MNNKIFSARLSPSLALSGERFSLLRPIGAGGQADVFLARPAGGGGRAPLAALKVARPDHADGLHDEHGWLSHPAAAHPSLTRLYARRPDDLGFIELCGGRRLCLALSYQPGRSLERILAARRRLPPALAVSIAGQAAAALDHLHRALRVAHGDVRPANLIVGPGRRPRVTLIDLGAAESLDTPRRRHIYGARGYVAPERLAGAPASGPADVYSLGITLRTMLGNQSAAPDLAALIRDATEGDPMRRAAAIPDMATMIARLRDSR